MTMRMRSAPMAILVCATMRAQLTQRVNPDLSVTYFVNAPDAKDVRLADDVFSLGPPGLPLVKGADGIWSVTTPPYEAGTHQYGFVVDGTPAPDLWGSARTDRMPRNFFPFELIDVHGSEPLPDDLRRVPHGTVHVEVFSSERFGREVRCWVYTPPGYDASGRRYPALYLLHGNANEPSHWITYGHADRIADNLIAGGARELVIVMPDTGDANRGNQPLDLVEAYLLDEVIPFVEQRYQIERSQSSRYLAGFSAGAVRTRHVGFLHPELFSALGLMSGGGVDPTPPVETTYPKLADPSAFKERVRLIYLSIGKDDASSATAVINMRILKDSLDRLGIPNVYNLSDGGHYFFNWRRYLAEFLTALP